MKQTQIACVLVAAVLLTMSSVSARAQYAVSQSTFTTGAGTASSGSHQIRATLGQPVAGVTSDATIAHSIGFWVGRALRVAIPAPLQVALGGVTLPGFTPTFGWSDVPGATSYTVAYAGDAGFVGGIEITGIATTQYTFPYPLADGAYYWRVKAVGEADESGYSTTDSFVIIPTFGEWTMILLALAMAGYGVWYARRIGV